MSEGKKSIIKWVDETIVNAASRFFENTPLGWALSNIPDYGPAIQTLMTVAAGGISSKRMFDLVEYIHQEILLIDQSKIDLTYFETEEGYDLFRRIFEYTLKTRDRKKIKLYARILVRTPILHNAVFRHSVEDFLLMLSELSPPDVVLAREVFNQQHDVPEDFENISKKWLEIANYFYINPFH